MFLFVFRNLTSTSGEQKILGKTIFSRGFSTFLITFHQKSLEPLEKVDFPKISSSPL